MIFIINNNRLVVAALAHLFKNGLSAVIKLPGRAVRYDDIYRMNEIQSLSFQITFYCLYRGVAKYIVSGNTFSSFE